MSEAVRVGQIWEDNDPRFAAGCRRRFKVLEIVGDKAVVETINGTTRKTKIKLDRFRPTPTGYKLIQDAE